MARKYVCSFATLSPRMLLFVGQVCIGACCLLGRSASAQLTYSDGWAKRSAAFDANDAGSALLDRDYALGNQADERTPALPDDRTSACTRNYHNALSQLRELEEEQASKYQKCLMQRNRKRSFAKYVSILKALEPYRRKLT